MRTALVSVATMTFIAGPALAADARCMARILDDVAGLGASEQVQLKKDEDFGPVDQIKVKRKTGKMYFCGRNSSCYDSGAFQLTTPCRIKRDTEKIDAEYFVFFTR